MNEIHFNHSKKSTANLGRVMYAVSKLEKRCIFDCDSNTLEHIMIYTIPTKRGLGVELWGRCADLEHLHEVIGRYWGDDMYQSDKASRNRDLLISGFSYEIRKASYGSRLTRNTSHFSPELRDHVGAKLSWVHMLFSLSALWFNMRPISTEKEDRELFLQLESSLLESMKSFDPVGAASLRFFVNGGIYAGNTMLYQFMRCINADYFLLGGGKNAFRKLPELLGRSAPAHSFFASYTDFLTKEAKRLVCDPSELDLNDDHVDYEKLVW